MTITLTDSAGRRWLTSGCSLVIVCGLMLPVSLIDLSQSQRPQSWPTTSGLIIESSVRSTTNSSGRLGVDVVYFPQVSYSYTIAGREYLGGNVYRGKSPDDQQSAQAVVKRYRAGSRVSVFYDPQAPHQSVLEPQVQPKDYYAVIGMLAGLLAGVACLLRFWKIRQEELGSSRLIVRDRPRPPKSKTRQQRKR